MNWTRKNPKKRSSREEEDYALRTESLQTAVPPKVSDFKSRTRPIKPDPKKALSWGNQPRSRIVFQKAAPQKRKRSSKREKQQESFLEKSKKTKQKSKKK